MATGPQRIVTAVAAFDGHDASILALNRALLAAEREVEVIYLGFNMTCDQIAAAALQEGADAVAVSSYNGGHLQFFPRLVELLAERGLATLVFGGGGGTIHAEDAAQLEAGGVEKVYGPGWALDAIALDMIERIERKGGAFARVPVPQQGCPLDPLGLSLMLSRCESGPPLTGRTPIGAAGSPEAAPPAGDGKERGKILIVSGDGGSGKSTLIDELVRHFLAAFPAKRLAILANDPSLESRGSVTAFLADRVRMNCIYDERVWLRSVATGSAYAPIAPSLPAMLRIMDDGGFDFVIVETPGAGQTGINLAALQGDLLVYVKTREYGSAFQLEKDQLLRDADLVVLNKVDLEGAEASFGEMRSVLAGLGKEKALYPTTSKAAGDPGTARLFAAICGRLGWPAPEMPPPAEIFSYAKRSTLVPHRRRAYLTEIADRVRAYDNWAAEQLRRVRLNRSEEGLDPNCASLLDEWPERWQELSLEAARKMGIDTTVVTPNGLRLSRVALPNPEDRPESLRFLLEEGLPGEFPFVTGIFPYRPASAGETTRQFAGLRGPEETNQRLHFLARGVPKPRLSIAFDGITLYGADSDDDPGSIGKIGEGGVAIDSWEDVKLVLDGFSIPEISTSMTINGPAAIILAMYFVAACEIERERVERERGMLSESERDELRQKTLRELRGTVQADILKEVQAQNENIFQTDFAIKLLGDVQEWFIENGVDKFYSLSISGYHIGEAGASPAQEIAFTLANGFTYLENFRARGMGVDAFAPSFSFFFRVSHEAEWLAYGAVCRKIWAIALRDVYGGNLRSQMFKFHTQTSGRALQAEEWDTLNPLRQTYHALMGLLANTNSLHVDSADEPMTTPGEKWVRQATMIPNYLREEAEGFVIQNLLSGSYAFREVMRELQARVLDEFERLDQLGGVGPATELGYQRRCIAENSAKYERERRRSGAGAVPPLRRIIGYNTHELPAGNLTKYPPVAEVVRPGPSDWERQLARVRDFKMRHSEEAPLYLARLQEVARRDGNTFAELLQTVRHATLGQITKALKEVGGEYRKMV